MSDDVYVFPLSFAQQRLWFLHQLHGGTPAHVLSASVALRDEVDVPALQRAIDAVVARHETLRTTFRVVDGEPSQVVAPALHVPLRRATAADATEAARIADDEVRRPFDLARGPLLRASLLDLDGGEVLVLTVHHIVADGWSLGVLFDEVSALYGAFARGGESPLPELPVQYADYALWQREWLSGGVLERELDHWRHQLEGLAPLELPTDRPRPVTPTFRAGEVPVAIDAATAERLDALAARERATPFMALLAAFAAVLSRYSGQEDVAVGVPIAGRTRREVEPLIGFFVNTLVLRVDLGRGPSFRELLGRVRETTLTAYAHQDVPFERLVEELAPERDLARNPLVQVVFQLQTGGDAALRVERAATAFDLTCDVWPSDGGYAGRLAYSSDLFDRDTVERLAGHFATLVAAAAEPDRAVDELDLLTPAERERVLADARGPAVRVPGARLHELVARRAADAPEAIAVVDGDRRLTYGELDRRANALAHRIAGRSELFALEIGRSLELAVAALGVLKAGAAYAPLDPASPAARRDLVLAAAGAPPVLRLADVGEELAELPPGVRVAPTDLAYVIHTSGSTGRPKGVQIAHGSLENLVAWHLDAYDLTAGDRTTLLAAPSFDASVWELWPSLVAGATVHVVADPLALGPDALRTWLARERIDVAFLPTPLAETVLDGAWPPDLALRALLTGGDVLRRVPSRPLPFRLVNHYGPTETTVVATACDVPVPAEGGAPPPIGRPIANTRAYVADRTGRPLPVGIPGELLVAGAGLARGYLGDREATARAFVATPLEERAYRTGDRVRRRRDGMLEFLGRVDRQVKVRGHRIELGEVEHVLASHPSVDVAVAAAPAAPNGAPRLVAYVTPASADPAALREHARRLLPAAAAPSAVIALDALPLTAHGKVDLDRLPQPAPQGLPAAEPPRTDLEASLVELWAEVLGHDSVGVHDNFFDLGGHSLSAFVLMARVHERFGADVPLARLFLEPTVEALALAVVEARAAEVDDAALSAMLAELDAR